MHNGVYHADLLHAAVHRLLQDQTLADAGDGDRQAAQQACRQRADKCIQQELSADLLQLTDVGHVGYAGDDAEQYQRIHTHLQKTYKQRSDKSNIAALVTEDKACGNTQHQRDGQLHGDTELLLPLRFFLTHDNSSRLMLSVKQQTSIEQKVIWILSKISFLPYVPWLVHAMRTAPHSIPNSGTDFHSLCQKNTLPRQTPSPPASHYVLRKHIASEKLTPSALQFFVIITRLSAIFNRHYSVVSHKNSAKAFV